MGDGKVSERKPGVYLCKGCGIADAVDVDALEKIGKSEFRIGHCVTSRALCSPESVASMRKDIDDGAVNRLVVGACSPRVMADKFRFDGVPVVRANLREQVAWSQPPHAEDTEMLAADAIRMAAAQLSKTEQPQPAALGEVARSILVVGAGVTGLTAALEAAKSGYDVVLVEKSDALGGWSAKWSMRAPHAPPYRDLYRERHRQAHRQGQGREPDSHSDGRSGRQHLGPARRVQGRHRPRRRGDRRNGRRDRRGDRLAPL